MPLSFWCCVADGLFVYLLKLKWCYGAFLKVSALSLLLPPFCQFMVLLRITKDTLSKHFLVGTSKLQPHRFKYVFLFVGCQQDKALFTASYLCRVLLEYFCGCVWYHLIPVSWRTMPVYLGTLSFWYHKFGHFLTSCGNHTVIPPIVYFPLISEVTIPEKMAFLDLYNSEEENRHSLELTCKYNIV